MSNHFHFCSYFETNDKYFPSTGISGTLYLVDLEEYGPNLFKIESLMNRTGSEVRKFQPGLPVL